MPLVSPLIHEGLSDRRVHVAETQGHVLLVLDEFIESLIDHVGINVEGPYVAVSRRG